VCCLLLAVHPVPRFFHSYASVAIEVDTAVVGLHRICKRADHHGTTHHVHMAAAEDEDVFAWFQQRLEAEGDVKEVRGRSLMCRLICVRACKGVSVLM